MSSRNFMAIWFIIIVGFVVVLLMSFICYSKAKTRKTSLLMELPFVLLMDDKIYALLTFPWIYMNWSLETVAYFMKTESVQDILSFLFWTTSIATDLTWRKIPEVYVIDQLSIWAIDKDCLWPFILSITCSAWIGFYTLSNKGHYAKRLRMRHTRTRNFGRWNFQV